VRITVKPDSQKIAGLRILISASSSQDGASRRRPVAALGSPEPSNPVTPFGEGDGVVTIDRATPVSTIGWVEERGQLQ